MMNLGICICNLGGLIVEIIAVDLCIRSNLSIKIKVKEINNSMSENH